MKSIIFDLYETLVTEWGRYKYTTREIASDLKIDYQAFRREWEALHDDRYLGKYTDSTQVYKRILENLNINRDESLLSEISQKRDECKLKCFETIEPQIIEMLYAIKTKGYKIGLISNCSYEEVHGFHDCNLYKFFDVIVFSCEVGLIKPDIKIYQYCVNELNEDPSDCIFIGDGGSDELNGAKTAGMNPLRALWFTKNFIKNYDADKSYPIFYEPSELTAFLSNNI